MRATLFFIIWFTFCGAYFALDVNLISIDDISVIALRQAHEQWGEVFADEPIPQYDRKGNLVAWQFNFSLGKPFPDREELKERCRQSEAKLWNEDWNPDIFANMLLGARTDKPALIAYSKGLSYDYSYLSIMEKLATERAGKDFKLLRMVHVNMGSRWFVVSASGREYYIRAFAPPKVVGYDEFLTLTDGLETPLVPMDFTAEWDEYLNGRTNDRASAYIPYPEKMPFYQWVLGCSPCAASMLAAWWDNTSGYHSEDYSNLVKYHFEAYDNIQGHTDYHITDAVNSLAYYMGTDDEGSTQDYNIDDGYDDFFNSRDYGIWTDSDDIYWEFLWDYDDLFYAARGQIRQGKPLHLSIPGHSVTGMGYSTSSHHLLLHDPNSPVIESWYQSEFDMITYVHPSTSGWSSHVELISPDGGQYWHSDGGGETFQAGSLREIKWEGDFDAGTYAKIWYHLDRGESSPGWTLITANTPNDGIYDWQIPSGLSSTKCRIKVEVYNSSNQLIGADGSYGNFTISVGGSNAILSSGTPVTQTYNPAYYRMPDNESSWAAVGTLKHNDSSGMGIKLYDSINLGALLAASETGGMNLIAVDRNHLTDTEYGVKVTNANGFVGGMTEYEGGNHQLANGLNTGLTWSDFHAVKMWDLQLSAGIYNVNLDITSGSHDLGMALFSSSGASYIRVLGDAIAVSDVSGNGGDESFVVSISTSDRYGLCVFSKDFLITGATTNFSINVGTPGLWTGANGRSWILADNWSNGQVPGNSTDVYIPSGCTNYPYVFGGITANCRSLTIGTGAMLEIGSTGTLSTHGGYTNVYGTLKISSTSALAILNGHTNWQTGSTLTETAGGTIRAAGNWVEFSGSSVEIDLVNVIMDGAESSVIVTDDYGNHFQNLTIAKSSGNQVSYSIESDYPLSIWGNLTVNSGAIFHGWSSDSIILKGNLVSYGGLALENSRLKLSSGSQQSLTCGTNDFFGDLEIVNNTTANLLSDIYLKGSLLFTQGFLYANSRKLSLEGNWMQNFAINSYIGNSTARVVFTGNENATCAGLNFKVLEIAKTGNAEVQILTGSQVQCSSLDWTSGVVRVNGGSLLAVDLADPNVEGSYILESGQIDLFQDSVYFVDLDADLFVYGGTFNIHGGYSFPSEWAYTESCQITMTGGVLDFMNNGIWLRNTGHYLVCDISGGTIRTSGDFKVERNGFNPTGGTIELYGTGNSTLLVSSPSETYDVELNKAGRESGVRTNQVNISANTYIGGNCTIQAGSILYVADNVQLNIGQSLLVYGTVQMNGANAYIDANSSIKFWAGSTANITNGTMNMVSQFVVDEGSSFNLPAAVKLIIDSYSGIHTYVYPSTTSRFGTVQYQNTASNLAVLTNHLELNGDLIIKPNCYITTMSDIIVDGKIDIWNLGTLNIAGNDLVSAANLYNSGLLNLPSGYTGSLTVANTFLQYSTGQLAMHGGSLILNGAYTGALYAFGGTTNMSGGTLQITNNGMQIGTSGFTFTGGTIRLGWSFVANNPNTLQTTIGMLELTGTLSASISLGTGNYLGYLKINKTGTSGNVYLSTNATIKNYLWLHSGKLYVNHHILNVEGDIHILTGQLYGNNADDEIRIGGIWKNYYDQNNFAEGTGLVKFISTSNTKRVDRHETFYNLIIETEDQYVEISEGCEVNVSGNLDIFSGKLRPLKGTELNVMGNLTITGSSSYLDQNFRRVTAPTSVHVYGNCVVNEGRIISVDTNDANPMDLIVIDGSLTMTGGYLVTLDADMTVHGSFTTTSSTYLETRGGVLINDAPYTGSWQIINCEWITWGNAIEFTNKGVQFISGAMLDNNETSVIRTGRGLYAVTDGVLNELYGAFEFTGSIQANINLGGNNFLPSVIINKTGAAVVLSTNAFITGDLTIQSGNFNSNNYTITLRGSWANNIGASGYTCGTSELICSTLDNGETISGDQTFYKLTINPATGKGISISDPSAITVSTDLAVNSGYLYNNSTLQVNGNVMVASGAVFHQWDELKVKGNLTDQNTTLTPTQGFACAETSVTTFNGTSTQTITVGTSEIYLGGFTLDKSGGAFQPDKNMNFTGNLTVQNGTWGYGASGRTHTIRGSFTVASGGTWNDNTGELKFTSLNPETINILGTANLKNIRVDKYQNPNLAALTLLSNLTINTSGYLVVDGGVLDIGNKILQLNGDMDINTNAKVQVGPGGILKVPNGSSVEANTGGTVSLIGSSSQPATITRVTGNYELAINAGGSIEADWAVFEYMNADGLQILSGATVNPSYPFNHCTFRYGTSDGTLLTFDNGQTLQISDARFPGVGTIGFNVTKNLNQGTVSFTGESGGYAGSGFESDPYSRVFWSTDVPQISVNPGSLDFGEVTWSQNSLAQGLMIYNWGNATLLGTIATPEGYSVTPFTRLDEDGRESSLFDKTDYSQNRNLLEFNIPAGWTFFYDVVFSPPNPLPYSGNIIISSNAANNPTVNVLVSGTGVGSQLALDPTSLWFDLLPGQNSSELLLIGNTGPDSLSYNAWIQPMRDREVVLETGFEDSCPPPGWSITQVSGFSSYWFRSTQTSNPYGSPPFEGSYLAYFNSYSSVAGNQARLESPELDLSVKTGVQLSLWMFHESGYPTRNDRVQIQYSINGGAWQNAGAPISRNTGQYSWQQHFVDLSAVNNQSNVRIGILGISEYGNDIHIDDVQVTGTTALPPDWLQLNGASFISGFVFPDEPPASVTVTVNTSGIPEGWYMNQLMIMSNDPQYPLYAMPLNVLIGTPAYITDPTSLNFGWLMTGNSATQSFILSSTGTQSLYGSVSTPAGYSVATARILAEQPSGSGRAKDSTASRNSLDYHLYPGESQTFWITFAPENAQSYDSQLTISSNLGTDGYLPLYGQGIAIPVVETGPVTEITQNSALCSGNVTSTGNMPITQRGIVWNTYGDPILELDNVVPSPGQEGQFTVPLTNLAHNQIYYVKAFVETSIGRDYGDEAQFTTLSPVVYVTPDSLPDFGHVPVGGQSAPQTITISGERLVDFVTLSVISAFELSLTPDTGYGSSVTLYPTGDVLPPTNVFVRFSPDSVGYALEMVFPMTVGTGGEILWLAGTGVTTPQVETATVTLITPASAMVSARIVDDGLDPVSQCGVCWSTTSGPTLSDPHTEAGTQAGWFENNLTGLSPYTLYYVRSYATNLAGTVFGNEVQFTTQADPQIVLDVSALDPFGSVVLGQVTIADTLTVSGTQLSNDLLLTAPVGFQLSLTPSGRTFTSTLSLVPVTGNIPPTPVYVRFAPATGGNLSNYIVASSTGIDDLQTLVSGIGITTATVSTEEITDVTFDSALGGGTIHADGWSPVSACGVCWSVAANPTLANEHTVQYVEMGPFSSVLSGLASNTTYHVRAYATNAAGTVYGDDVSFQTPLGTLDPPQNFTISILGADVVLGWSTVANANSYKVYRSADPYTADWGIPVAVVANNQWAEAASSLLYFYKVVASTDMP
jgi:hypothetical protein